MKLNKSILLFFVIILCFFAAIGQTKNCIITGQVKDGENIPVADVSVHLLRAVDSGVVKFVTPNDNGFFKFNDVRNGDYLIQVTGAGFTKTTTKLYVVNTTVVVDIGIITVKKISGKLIQVNIVANKPIIELEPGKTILNVQSSVLADGSNALNILQQYGVKVDADNNISLNGRAGVLVLIDGRPTYLPADALVTLLQGTQSNTIDQIEFISNPGASYDAASAGGVINIKLKKNENYGTSGSINLAALATEMGDDYGTRFDGVSALTINNRSKNLDIFGSYSLAYIPSNRVLTSDRFIKYQSLQTEITSNFVSRTDKATNTFRVGADFNIESNQILGFLLNGATTSFVLSKNTNTSIADKGAIDSTIATTSQVNNTTSNINYDINYKVTFKKLGELSVDADYSTYHRQPLESINSSYYKANGYLYRTLGLQNNYASDYNIYNYNVDYTFSTNATSTLKVLAKSSYVGASNDLDFGEIVAGQYHSDPTFTNQFNFTERINSGAITYIKELNKKINGTAGLRIEQTIFDGESIKEPPVKNNYTDFFPSLQINDNINANNQLQFSYGRTITRPLYFDLNPFVAYQDQYSYYIGNPYLKPFYSQLLQLSNLYKGKFKVEFSLNLVNNFTQSIYIQNDTTKIVYSKKVNLGNRHTYRMVLTEQLDVTNWWAANCRLSAFYDEFSATPSQGVLNANTTDFDLRVVQNFTIFKGFKAEVSSEYETPTTYGVFKYKPLFSLSGGISKALNKQTSINLYVNDVFNSYRDRFSSNYQNLNVSVIDQKSFRTILFSFAYKFGSKTVKAERARKTGAETEQGRAAAQQQ